ncbi:MAG: nickel pincer cofactor biosynthesis protein LarB [Candidatus Omnitrophica bacterium]|nr:nickel pincer cofactor biosynthesis protein LarB [Candidatus Omnitrophota bacterium]
MRGKQILRDALEKVRDKRLSVREAGKILSGFPSMDMKSVNLDCGRYARCGFPEVIYCEGKTLAQIKLIARKMIKCEDFLLLTRLSESAYKSLKKTFRGLKYNRPGRVAYHSKNKAIRKKKSILVITGGTSDIPVAEEACATLEAMGNAVDRLYDVGVAGVHRLLNKVERLHRSNIIIVVAGMEGALASVVGGLVSKPIIAVPTSCGYGANFKGLAPLLTMLNSCSPGVAVVNIDNGFGAAYIANLINKY